MTALGLKRVVEEALARVGADINLICIPRGKPRTTTWLGIEHGFGIRHYATGRNVYIVQTRMGGKLRTITLGPASVLTRAQATQVARVVLAYARVGEDPASERKRIRSAPRYSDFLDEFWERWGTRWTPKTWNVNASYRRLYLQDAFQGLCIDELNEEHVTRWFAEVNRRTGPGAANMTLALLNAMLNKAEVWGYRLENTNPCRAVRMNRRNHLKRFLSHEEMQRLGTVLTRERASDKPMWALAAKAVTLLALTGCRRGEILGLHWQDVHGIRLKLRHGKTGPRMVWMGDDARAELDTCPRYKGVPWVFWNPTLSQPVKDLHKYWNKFRDDAGLRDFRLHDLRHNFASHAAMNKETLPMIGRLLGHARVQSTARYAHLDDGHALEAAEQIGAAVERMLG